MREAGTDGLAGAVGTISTVPASGAVGAVHKVAVARIVAASAKVSDRYTAQRPLRRRQTDLPVRRQLLIPAALLTALMIFATPLLKPASSSLRAQVIMTPQSMGVGGAGTSYITGVESLFLNPANLQIRDKTYRLQLSAGLASITDYTFLKPLSPRDRAEQLQDLLTSAVDIPTQNSITPEQRTSILKRNFSGNRTTAFTYHSADLVWFGFKWFGRRNSFALAARSRMSSKSKLGRGFFDVSPVLAEASPIIDRSLHQTYQILHEVSLGYSQSISFLNDLSPGLSEWIVGIAPKAVFAGPYSKLVRVDRYTGPAGTSGSVGSSSAVVPDENWQRTHSYTHTSAGETTSLLNSFAEGTSPITAIDGFYQNRGLSEITGYGAGLDIGVTYVMTFQRDLSVVLRNRQSTRQSLRLSVSMTDLGIVRYGEQPLRLSSDEIFGESLSPQDLTGLSNLSAMTFTGGLGEDLFFLSQFGVHPRRVSEEESRLKNEPLWVLLPTSLQAGAMLQLHRIAVVADLQLGLDDTAFTSSRPMVFVGTEMYLLPFLPVRAGLRVADQLRGYYSLGAGLELPFMELHAAIQLRSDKSGPTTEVIGAALAGLRLNFGR